MAASKELCRFEPVKKSEERLVVLCRHIAETVSRLAFVKILFLDIGLSLSDAITDLIQSIR